MNDAAAAASNQTGLLSASSYGTLTGIALVLVALFAIVVVIAVVHGARLKRERVAADEAVEENAVAAGVAPAPPAADDQAVPDAEPEPVDPEPQPLAGERIAAAAPLDASPAAEAASPPSGDAASPADGPVSQLKGLGPKVTARLAELGITTVGQVAALTDDRAEAIDAQLGPFSGRMGRDRWIEQARFLAAGDRAGFEAVFGKL